MNRGYRQVEKNTKQNTTASICHPAFIQKSKHKNRSSNVLLCNQLQKQIPQEFMQKFLQSAEDYGKENPCEVIPSSD